MLKEFAASILLDEITVDFSMLGAKFRLSICHVDHADSGTTGFSPRPVTVRCDVHGSTPGLEYALYERICSFEFTHSHIGSDFIPRLVSLCLEKALDDLVLIYQYDLDDSVSTLSPSSVP